MEQRGTRNSRTRGEAKAKSVPWPHSTGIKGATHLEYKKGFQTSILQYVLLEIDIAHKILRTESVLEQCTGSTMALVVTSTTRPPVPLWAPSSSPGTTTKQNAVCYSPKSAESSVQGALGSEDMWSGSRVTVGVVT